MVSSWLCNKLDSFIQTCLPQRTTCYFPVHLCDRPFTSSCLWVIPACKWYHLTVCLIFLLVQPQYHLSHRYFIKMLVFFSSAPFYNQYVHLPPADVPTPPEIWNNPKFYPFSRMLLVRSMEHISTAVLLPKCIRQLAIAKVASHKIAWPFVGLIWDSIIYLVGGMDRWQTQQCSMTLASQISIFQQVNITLQTPDFQYEMHLSSPSVVCATTLQNGAVPNSGAACLNLMLFYYLKFDYRPANADKLFNLWYVSACNVIEWIFGVLKRRFRILVYPAEINMDF